MTARIYQFRPEPIEPIRDESEYRWPPVPCFICLALVCVGLWWIGWLIARMLWGAFV